MRRRGESSEEAWAHTNLEPDRELNLEKELMSEWVEVSNWEACKAKSEGKEVEIFILNKWILYENDWEFDPEYKYRIKTPGPARLLGKVIWTKDEESAQRLSDYKNEYYKVYDFMSPTRNKFKWMTTLEIEQEFDIKD